MCQMKMKSTHFLGEEFVSLKVPLGEGMAKHIGEQRKLAQKEFGKDSGEEIAWKLLANTMYGVLASPYYPINNYLAANLITAKARAEAFAITMVLNGIQLITDGCTYRADQIPACTFSECLGQQLDYPLNRAESGITFFDSKSIPTETQEFTNWYINRAKEFFGVTGEAYDKLFSTHSLGHKSVKKGDPIEFDGLVCDGMGNYIKYMQTGDGNWEAQEIKFRSYGEQSKSELVDWITEVYSTDSIHDLPPITEDQVLIQFNDAVSVAKKKIEDGAETVFLPLGMPFPKFMNYRVIKFTEFVYQSPEQRTTIIKQIKKFEGKHGCGIELLALRRSYGNLKRGSLRALTEEIYRFIQSGERDITKKFNLNRLNVDLKEESRQRNEFNDAQKYHTETTRESLFYIRPEDVCTLPTGILMDADNQYCFD